MTDGDRKSIETNLLKVYDDSLYRNAENANGVGLEVRVSREYDNVGLSGNRECTFCKERECDNVTLQEAYSIGAFQRHEGCGCVIEYVSAKGERTYQAGKSGPNDWLSDKEFQKRVNYRLDNRKVTPQERVINAAIEMQRRDKHSLTLVNAIVENHEALENYTPSSMKARLEKAGFEVKSLKKGSLKNKPFEKGGGYKINFGSDAIFQYHPENKSHHEGAYWKIKAGKVEERYDMGGNKTKY